MARKTVSRRSRGKPRPPAGVGDYLRELGPMRLFMLLLAIVDIAAAPRPGTEVVMSGWQLWTTLVSPTLAPIIFMVLMLDALMSWVMMTDTKGDVRGRYRRIAWINLLAGAVLLASWMPFFLKMFRG
jgi:hypothetical protein